MDYGNTGKALIDFSIFDSAYTLMAFPTMPEDILLSPQVIKESKDNFLKSER